MELCTWPMRRVQRVGKSKKKDKNTKTRGKRKENYTYRKRERKERITMECEKKGRGGKISSRRGHILRFCDGTRVVSVCFNVKGGALTTSCFCNNTNVWVNWRILYQAATCMTSSRLTLARLLRETSSTNSPTCYNTHVREGYLFQDHLDTGAYKMKHQGRWQMNYVKKYSYFLF